MDALKGDGSEKDGEVDRHGEDSDGKSVLFHSHSLTHVGRVFVDGILAD